MDKIDIRDLRVGNWLSVHHPTMPAENIQISADWIRTIEHINNGLIKEDSPLFRIVEPIPLTKEILEKNGFVENRGITSWKFETKREDLIEIYGVNDYHLSINIEDTHGSGKGYRWILNNLVIFYAHQLQNILRDLGIEKEITI